MKRIGLLPGTFDPPTLGHLDLIERAKKLCDHLVVAIALKPSKNSFFSIEERIHLIQKIAPHTEIVSFHGLIADLAKQIGATYLIRGIRGISDFECETQMAIANRRLSGIETLFLIADEKHTQISSTLIREIAFFGGTLRDFVPPSIEEEILHKLKGKK